MARITIEDLKEGILITEKQLRRVMGGFNPQPEPPARRGAYLYYPPTRPADTWSKPMRFR